MKKLINELLDVDKKTVIFLIIICIIGIVTGSIFMTILSTNDKDIVIESLDNFIALNGQINTKISLTNNLNINLLYCIIIWLLGISIIGLPIVIFILFMKSFLLSFTISSFIYKYKTKGLLLGIIYNLPHQVINLIIYLYLGVYSIKLSSFILKAIVYKKNINFKNITNRYLIVLLFSVIILIISTLYETYIMPSLLKKVFDMI